MFLEFLDSGPFPGDRNMAIDLEWMEKVARRGDRGVIRFYQWQPYCLSLGHHQSWDSVDHERCCKDGIDVVVRPTGGRAVLHAEELTYSVILPVDELGSVHHVYRRISEALAEGLRAVGVPAHVARQGDDLRSHYRSVPGASCFSSSTEYEIQIDGRKIVGSAQRRSDGAMLQHGSILIGPFHRRIVNYLKLTPEQRHQMEKVLIEKTTELHTHGNVELEALKSSIARSLRRHLMSGAPNG
jgi:lipoate-protein ligase A